MQFLVILSLHGSVLAHQAHTHAQLQCTVLPDAVQSSHTTHSVLCLSHLPPLSTSRMGGSSGFCWGMRPTWDVQPFSFAGKYMTSPTKVAPYMVTPNCSTQSRSSGCKSCLQTACACCQALQRVDQYLSATLSCVSTENNTCCQEVEGTILTPICMHHRQLNTLSSRACSCDNGRLQAVNEGCNAGKWSLKTMYRAVVKSASQRTLCRIGR